MHTDAHNVNIVVTLHYKIPETINFTKSAHYDYSYAFMTIKVLAEHNAINKPSVECLHVIPIGS